MRIFVVSFLLSVLNLYSYAQTLQRLELGTRTIGGPLGYKPYKDKLYFIGQGSNGKRTQLWACDSAGLPVCVSAIDTDNNGITYAGHNGMIEVNGLLYFQGVDQVHGYELWGYDGVNQPFLIKDIIPGQDGSTPAEFTLVDSMLYFTGYHPSLGAELYSLNIKTHDARLVKDVVTGTRGSQPLYKNYVKGKLYFKAQGYSSFDELYAYIPSKDSVYMIEIGADNTGSSPQSIIEYNGNLYFSAFDTTYGAELYTLDAAGSPMRLTDIASGSSSAFQMGMSDGIGVLNGKLYFNAAADNGEPRQLYEYDTLNHKIRKPFSSVSGLNTYGPTGFATYHSKLYFFQSDSVGSWLWRYDGTTKSPERVALMVYIGYNATEKMIVFKDWLYFSATSTLDSSTTVYRYMDSLQGTVLTSVSFKADVKVYPNPVTDKLNIQMQLQTNETLSIGLYDINGRQVYNSGEINYNSGQQLHSINMSDLAKGGYFYAIMGKDKQIYSSGKVLKL